MTVTPLTSTSKQLAVLGAGPIGRTIGRRWVEAGHTVAFGTRNPDKLRDLVGELGPTASAHTLRGAVATADTVLLAVAHVGTADVLAELREDLAGKTLIDATNPMGLDGAGRIISTLPSGTTQGTHTASLLPQTRVVRAFTHIMAELLDSRGRTQPMFWAMAIAGDDPVAMTLTAELVRATGFTPVPIGDLAASAALEPGGSLFPHIFTSGDLRSMLAD